MRRHADGNLSLFQVAFTVQIGSFDEAGAERVRRSQEQHVCRHGLIARQMHHVTHHHVPPLHSSVPFLDAKIIKTIKSSF